MEMPTATVDINGPRPPHAKKRTDEERRLIAEEAMHATDKAVAARYGLHRITVFKWRHRFGMKKPQPKRDEAAYRARFEAFLQRKKNT